MALIHHYKLNGDGMDSIGGVHLYPLPNSDNLIYTEAKIGKGIQKLVINEPQGLVSTENIWLSQSHTFACWAFVTDAGTSANGLITNHSHGDNTGGGITVKYISSDDYRISCNTGNGTSRTYHSYYGTTNIKNVWSHLVYRYDHIAKKVSLWVNGQLEQEVSYNMVTKLDKLALFVWSTTGAYISNSSYRPAAILDDVRIYDHALSDREVRDLSLGIVTHLKMTDFTDSTNNSIDIQSNNAVLYDEPPRPCLINDAGVTNRHLIIKDAPAVTHDQTISLWLYPTSNERRRNPWNRAYGGEGTVVHEPTGKLAYYWGTHGENGSPYYARSTSSTLPLNEWTHAVVVRDVTNQQIRWYINGKLDSSWSGTIGTIPESKSNVLIGTGYTSPYQGRIGEVRQYATALTESQIKELYHQIASIDSNGTLHTSHIHETGIHQSIKNCNWTTWQVGQEGSVGDFTANGGASQSYKSSRILALNPWGKEAVVWKGIGKYTGVSSSDADGGFNVNRKPVDPTKMYRLSIWMKRSVTGNGSTYFGASATPSVLRKSSGTVNTNPYFLSSNNSAEENKSNEWHLWVGHIWPAGSSTGATYTESGVYNLSGTKIREISDDFIWAEGTTSGNLRAFLYYVTDETTEELFCYPRMDICDGTEPQLSELLSGFDSANESLFRLYDGEIPPIKFSTKLIGNFNEVDENGDPISAVAIDGLTMNIKQINEV